MEDGRGWETGDYRLHERIKTRSFLDAAERPRKHLPLLPKRSELQRILQNEFYVLLTLLLLFIYLFIFVRAYSSFLQLDWTWPCFFACPTFSAFLPQALCRKSVETSITVGNCWQLITPGIRKVMAALGIRTDTPNRNVLIKKRHVTSRRKQNTRW